MQHGANLSIATTEMSRFDLQERVTATGEASKAKEAFKTAKPLTSSKGPVRAVIPAHPSPSPSARAASVKAQELQTAVILIFALYASLALLNFRTEFSALFKHWQSFVEFATHMLW